MRIEDIEDIDIYMYYNRLTTIKKILQIKYKEKMFKSTMNTIYYAKQIVVCKHLEDFREKSLSL